MKLNGTDFEPIFGKVSDYVLEKIHGYGFEHSMVTHKKSQEAVLDMVKAVYHDALPVSGPARHPVWEKGWGENLAYFDPIWAGRELAKPRYYNKFPIVRWQGDLYVPRSEDYEHNMLAIIQDWVFDKYLRQMGTVMEFGCGTGHNLFRVRDVNPAARLVGLDWAQSAVKFVGLQAMAGAYGPGPAHSVPFDFFNPQPVIMYPDTAFVTVAALEQVGTNWKPFFDFVMKSQPKIVIHIEPIEEVLDPDVLLDHLCLGYFKKRGYLSGWLRHLKLSHELNKITLHEVRRTHIGSKFIEGYTVVAWSPCPESTSGQAQDQARQS